MRILPCNEKAVHQAGNGKGLRHLRAEGNCTWLVSIQNGSQLNYAFRFRSAARTYGRGGKWDPQPLPFGSFLKSALLSQHKQCIRG